MEEQLKDRIERSGLKKKNIAEKIGVTPNFLSMCISGTRRLSDEKIQKLKELV